MVAAAAAQADAVAVAVERHLPVYDGTGRTVADVVADLLVERGQTLAVAESCTGGALGARIVDRPGSSAYFRGGVISYANDVKEALLGVPARRSLIMGRCRRRSPGLWRRVFAAAVRQRGGSV